MFSFKSLVLLSVLFYISSFLCASDIQHKDDITGYTNVESNKIEFQTSGLRMRSNKNLRGEFVICQLTDNQRQKLLQRSLDGKDMCGRITEIACSVFSYLNKYLFDD